MATPGIPEVSRYGLTQVHAPIGGGKVDVVFVHGLNGDPHNTWTAEKSQIFWPAQLLPLVLEEEKARILVYGYDADVASFMDGASKDKIHNHAEHLVAELAANRRIRKATERPIIFVAHSLGGLVVKRALIYSSEIRGNYTEHLRSIFVSTYGILFLGTPHRGSNLAAWGSRLEAICNAVLPSRVVDTNKNLVKALKTDNETLQNIDRQFIQLISRFHVYFFHEGKPTKLGGGSEFVVDEDSASPTVQDVERAVIQADHSHMCKFESDGAAGFDLVAEGIQRYAGEAPAIIGSRWDSERTASLAKKKAEIEEILPDTSQILPDKNSPEMIEEATTTSNPSKPTEPYFIVPPGFRPNTFFVGLEKQYAELDKRLFSKRRREGTACVLLYGQAGGGKSHLARQYVHKNRKRFPGGIFWISASSKEGVKHAFWDISLKVVPRDSPDLCENVSPKDYIQLVKAWFESRHEWLMVFDGIAVERDEDTTDLANFVPNSKDSSIVYISRARNLGYKEWLLAPSPIKVGPLKEDEAKKLLFKKLHIRKPSEAENRKATELVRQVGGLPLAIDAISRRLADTREPLVKYKLATSADPGIEGTYNKILDDLQRLGYMEAWNLISILCWFAQDLPFEMVHLGLKILKAEKVDVRATEGTGKPDVDNTIAILIRYALLERNEPDDKGSMSSSRDSLNEPEPIDMLKIHSVIQNFRCDSLNVMGSLPQWLGYAVKLFSYSYHQADVKIKQKPEQGRVSDYRYYETHGKWLWNHTLHYERRTQSLEHVRAHLLPTMKRIAEEIREREPTSSQESLQNGVFQISIFDRSSSSSDSGPVGPITPDYRPTPPPLENETEFGFDKGHTMDSPASFGTASPGIRPKIVGYSPRLPKPEDPGYASDREGDHQIPMHRDISEMTAMPPRSRAPTTESHGGEWQVVRKPRKQPRGRRDLGTFRPTLARAQVNRETVTGSVQQSKAQKENRRGSSPAFQSLERVQSRSPPPSRAGVPSLFQRGLFSRPATTAPAPPTWAGVAAAPTGRSPQPPANALTTTQAGPSPADMFMDRGRSQEIPQARPGSAGAVQPSPLASEFVPDGASTGVRHTSPNSVGQTGAYSPASLHYTTPHPGSNTSLAQFAVGHRMENNPPAYQTPLPLGPNPAPLPYDNNITLTAKRPLPNDFSPHQPSVFPSPQSQQPSPQSRTSPYQQTLYVSDHPYPVVIPAGYSSQPMSRNHSQHLSRSSVAATDPIRYPSALSPQTMPAFPPDSPRDRHPDGRPYHKSPKTDHATLSHTGGWAYSPSPTLSTAPYAADISMSRSSSGPGVAIEGQPGGIVGFVQFGEHPPTDIEEVRRRTEAYERRLKGGEAPYPEVSAMPVNPGSELGVLRRMVPEEGERVGLGVEFEGRDG